MGASRRVEEEKRRRVYLYMREDLEMSSKVGCAYNDLFGNIKR